MFSGLIKSTTKIKRLSTDHGEQHLTIAIPDNWTTPLEIGQSIAVNGVCLSVEHFNDQEITFYVMRQTLEITNMQAIQVGDLVNVESPLRMNDYLNGHFVLGHVDGWVELLRKTERGNSCQLTFTKPSWLTKFLYDRTSICLNGVSLTVSHVGATDFSVNLIPLTQQDTNLTRWPHAYNVEVDHFSKMIEKLFELRKENC